MRIYVNNEYEFLCPTTDTEHPFYTMRANEYGEVSCDRCGYDLRPGQLYAQCLWCTTNEDSTDLCKFCAEDELS